MQEVVPVKHKRTYRTIPVQEVIPQSLVALFVAKVIVAIDVAKEAMVAGFADAGGRVVELVRFSHPTQTRLFVELVLALRAAGLVVEGAMEPTGVYGESLRHQLVSRGIDVFRVDPKRVHDASLILDGVPSQHDPKACTLIAFLHAQGISRRWPQRSPFESHARVLVDEHDVVESAAERLYGRLEASTAMHWPELNALVDRRTHWYLHLLVEHPGPHAAHLHEREVRTLLRRVSCGSLASSKIEEVVRSARDSLGVPVTEPQSTLLASIARDVLAARARLVSIEKHMRTLCAEQASCERVARAVGPSAALAIFGDLGYPSTYASAAAFEKACGLNLREQSSGKHEGRLHITKRGPARVRRYLYLAAMRCIARSPLVRAWYERRGACREGTKHVAIVAVMRKLVRALFHVARDGELDFAKLFDLTRLAVRIETASPTSLHVSA
jgi:transposase